MVGPSSAVHLVSLVLKAATQDFAKVPFSSDAVPHMAQHLEGFAVTALNFNQFGQFAKFLLGGNDLLKWGQILGQFSQCVDSTRHDAGDVVRMQRPSR